MSDSEDSDDIHLTFAKLLSITEASLFPDVSEIQMQLAIALSSQMNNQYDFDSDTADLPVVEKSAQNSQDELSSIIDEVIENSIQEQSSYNFESVLDDPDIISVIDEEINNYLSDEANFEIVSVPERVNADLQTNVTPNLNEEASSSSNDQSGITKNEFECRICLLKHSIKDSGSFGCIHLFCTSCLSEFLKNKLGNKEIIEVACPATGCTTVCSERTFREYLPSNLISEYEECIMLKNVESVEEITYCPQCNYPVECDNDIAVGTCSKCFYAFCTSCRKAFHGFQQCQDEEDNKKREKEIRQSEELIDKQFKKCPGCKTNIEKDVIGCNHMTCAKCKLDFCWTCLARLSNQEEIEHHYISQCVLFAHDFLED